MDTTVDFNAGSGFVYGQQTPVADGAARVNALIDLSLIARSDEAGASV